jgi:hypothetical protein
MGLVGCAASPVVDSVGGDRVDEDGGLVASEEPATPEDDDDEPGIDSNADPSAGETSAPGTVSPRLPDAGRANDAGSAPADAGPRDAGVKDAAIADAGRSSTGAADSGPAVPTTPPRDAGQSTSQPAAGKCRTDADCTEPCVPIGILNCCGSDGTCGCTWAPGAYCL